MKTLAELGIRIDQTRRGEQRVLCPWCSHQRRKSKERCLSVMRDDKGWLYHCWHCGEHGGVLDGDQRRSSGMGSKPRSKPSDFGAAARRIRNNFLSGS